MKALIVNCTLKASPEPSNTAALAEVVGDHLRGGYLESEEGRDWSHSTGRAAAANLLAAGRALQVSPIPPPPSD